MRSTWVAIICGLTVLTGLAGCTSFSCVPGCPSHLHNASSLVDFLYPNHAVPPAQNRVPQLRVPLRVGLAFLPSTGSEATEGLDDAHKEELLERIKQRFSSRQF